VEQDHGPDGERATTTVTWNGCRRGESFEGWSAIGNGTGDRVSHSPRAAKPAAPPRRSEWSAATRQKGPGTPQGELETGRAGTLLEGRAERHENHGPETWRTPWLAAGCNRPAISPAEKTAEAGRNGKGGTSSKGGSFGPKEVYVSCQHRTLRGTRRHRRLLGARTRPGVDAGKTCRRRGDH
jgi:hypothetical protein